MVSKPEAPDEFDFAAKLKELEDITTWFETSDINLTQALQKFEKGMELAASLKQHLQNVENRVVKIKKRFESEVSLDEKVSDDLEVARDDGLDLGLF